MKLLVLYVDKLNQKQMKINFKHFLDNQMFKIKKKIILNGIGIIFQIYQKIIYMMKIDIKKL